MAFSPVKASRNITEKYYRYLKTSFNIGEPYSAEFETLLKKGNVLAKGPFLDLTDSFKSGHSIKELIEEGLLPKSFSRINMNQTRPLYVHQEKALRKVAEEGRNLVVSTGTGSGKTESFLLPVLRYLVGEVEQGTICPGVRALFVYPMNALANDQIERLRAILVDFPEITFGVYTGQTERKKDKALVNYKSLNDNKVPLENELISREEMTDNPPHILITNYAMLEYLMIRPLENVFFEGDKADFWKFIVFDEAHVYYGSTGIEVSMLFRRLRAKLNSDKLTYILTSATLGDEESNEQVAEFAHNLCNAPFSSTDVIRAFRNPPEPSLGIKKLDVSVYSDIANCLDLNYSDSKIISEFSLNDSKTLSENLFDLVINDENYWNIRELLKRPKTVKFVSEKLGWTEDEVASFVTVASLCENGGIKLFDARYHMFLRSTESAFITLAPHNHIYLERHNKVVGKTPDEIYKAFEVATCSYCNSVYLIGRIERDILEPYTFSDEDSIKDIFLLSNNLNDTDGDHTLEDEGIDAEEYLICPHCGFVKKKGVFKACEHDEKDYVTVYKLKLTEGKQVLTKCPKCEGVNVAGVLRTFYSGQEAATSVIGTALFEELPSYEVKIEETTVTDEEFSDIFTDEPEEFEIKTKKAKQFIAFSDSRQAAAYYASYLNITYNNILYKRIILEALKSAHSDIISARELTGRVEDMFNKYEIKGDIVDSADYNREKESWKAVLKELIDNNGKTSLNKFGLFDICFDFKGSYPKFKLSNQEFSDMCSCFALSMLSDGAINYDMSFNQKDVEFFTHNGIRYSYTESDSSGKHTKSFSPSKAGLLNKRIDYFMRIIQKKSEKYPDISAVDTEEAAVSLKKIWNAIFVKQNFVTTKDGFYRINFDKIQIGKNRQWYICSKCKQITSHNVENVCPTYKCDGTLTPVNCDDLFKDNHYYRIYNDLDIRDLSVVEHTAQLDRKQAYEYQNKFKRKEIDILSCSTTFEMGVDVGSLETVFMRNMPPSPSNYAQRAGRAGRSRQSSAFALTYCNKASHDFSYFKNPVEMIKGEIKPPKFKITNEKIGIRHLYASAMGMFWRKHPEYFKTIQEFVDVETDGKTGFEIFKEYLYSHPKDLKEYLMSFLPKALSDVYDVETFGWVDALVGDEGKMTVAIEKYKSDIETLKEEKDRLFEKGEYVDSIIQRIKTYSAESNIAFFSRNNILPKYGFPVDTVEMILPGTNSGLQLQRDLSMAISEYAPGSQVVANNHLITSRFIKKVPKFGWKTYSYVQCPNCKTLNKQVYVNEDTYIESCCQCHAPFEKSKTRTFIIPEMGFIAESDVKSPGLKKPNKTYRGEVSYSGFRKDVERKEYTLWGKKVVLMNCPNDEMAVLNNSNFYVCPTCGYATNEIKGIFKTLKHVHKNSNGFTCKNTMLNLLSLGYCFKTDVIRIDFIDNSILDWEKGYTILQALLRGICSYLSIEENDISGCLQKSDSGYEIVIYDTTPGGSGQAKRLDDKDNLIGSIKNALEIVAGCTCGGDEADTTCYSCLRNYRNQKYHDVMKRKDAIDFFIKMKN